MCWVCNPLRILSGVGPSVILLSSYVNKNFVKFINDFLTGY